MKGTFARAAKLKRENSIHLLTPPRFRPILESVGGRRGENAWYRRPSQAPKGFWVEHDQHPSAARGRDVGQHNRARGARVCWTCRGSSHVQLSLLRKSLSSGDRAHQLALIRHSLPPRSLSFPPPPGKLLFYLCTHGHHLPRHHRHPPREAADFYQGPAQPRGLGPGVLPRRCAPPPLLLFPILSCSNISSHRLVASRPALTHLTLSPPSPRCPRCPRCPLPSGHLLRRVGTLYRHTGFGLHAQTRHKVRLCSD